MLLPLPVAEPFICAATQQIEPPVGLVGRREFDRPGIGPCRIFMKLRHVQDIAKLAPFRHTRPRGRRSRLRDAERLGLPVQPRSEEPTSELQSLMRTSYAVFCLKKKQQTNRANYSPS